MKANFKRAPITVSYPKYSAWSRQGATKQLFFLESAWLERLFKQYAHGQMLYIGADTDIRSHLKYPENKLLTATVDWQVENAKKVANADFVMELKHWPLADESVDFLICQHMLEFSSTPHQMAREISRVLSPNGYALIISFNPFSYWGMMQKMRWLSVKMPWLSKPVSKHRLSDWFQLLGFRVERRFSFGHLWPSSTLSNVRMQGIDHALAQQDIWPGNAYALLVRKRVAAMTKVKTRRQQILNPSYGWAVSREVAEKTIQQNKKSEIKIS